MQHGRSAAAIVCMHAASGATPSLLALPRHTAHSAITQPYLVILAGGVEHASVKLAGDHQVGARADDGVQAAELAVGRAGSRNFSALYSYKQVTVASAVYARKGQQAKMT